MPVPSRISSALTSARRSLLRPVGANVGDPKREAVRRLRFLCAFASVAPLIGMALMILFKPAGSPIQASPSVYIGSMLTIVASSVLVHHVLGREDLSLSLRLDIGFAYQILGALTVSTMRHIVPWAPGDGFREVSPVAVLIVLFAALVPNVPRRTFLASLGAAAMEPLGLGITLALGNPTPTITQIIAICAGPIAAVGGATVISTVVYGLAQGVEEARRLGSYRLVSRLGAGGMGEVWRAEHDLLARPAAVKLIQPKGEGEAKRADLSRFEREAQATALLQSPHTVQLFDFGTADGGTFYYVMELLDGVDLEQLVRETGPLPPARVVHVLAQVCKSLDEAHAHGLVHRDVKPANVLLCRYGRELDFAKVLDFGLVKPAHEKDKQAFGATVTAANAIVGTPAYMAPEMVLSGEVDQRADLYSLGCLAYWLLTGRLVFDGDSLVKLAVQHLHDAPRPPSELSDAPVPPALDRLVLDCLAKDPAGRPASAEEVMRRLAALAAELRWTQDDARAFWDAHPLASSAAEAAFAPTVAAEGPKSGPADAPTLSPVAQRGGPGG